MYTTILLICCFGFFCLYNTSKRAKLVTGGGVEQWLQSNERVARSIGLSCLFLTIMALIWMDGAVMGTLNTVLMLMAAGCYIVGLAPFRFFKLNHLICIGLVAFLFEFLIF